MANKLVIYIGLATLCASSTASAAPEATKTQTERNTPSGGSEGGVGAGRAGGGASAGAAEPGERGSATDADVQLLNQGRIRNDSIWGVTAAFETHAALVQTQPDDSRSRPSKLYNYVFVAPAIYPSAYDQIRLSVPGYQFFTADQGESGTRLGDLALSYTRYIPIATEAAAAPSTPPLKGVLIGLEALTTAPTSFISQKRGIITVPRLRLFAEKAFLDRDLTVSLSAAAEHYFAAYRTAPGGAPNPSNRAVAEATADYRFPFYHPVSVGLLATTSYVYFYEVETSSALPLGVSKDRQFSGQPVQQGYGAEVHARYQFPTFSGIRSWASVAYSLGDNAVLHDGVQHIYFAYYRRSSEAYATLTARF